MPSSVARSVRTTHSASSTSRDTPSAPRSKVTHHRSPSSTSTRTVPRTRPARDSAPHSSKRSKNMLVGSLPTIASRFLRAGRRSQRTGGYRPRSLAHNPHSMNPVCRLLRFAPRMEELRRATTAPWAWLGPRGDPSSGLELAARYPSGRGSHGEPDEHGHHISHPEHHARAYTNDLCRFPVARSPGRG